MTANATSPSSAPYPVLQWVGTGAFAFFAVALVYMLITGLIYGPAARAAAEREQAMAIEKESRVFCTGLGLVAGSELYASCTDGLAEIRRRHQERLTSDLDIL